MGNLSSAQSFTKEEEYQAAPRAERSALAKKCVALLQIYFPDTNLDTVLLLPRDAFLRHGHMPTFEDAKKHLRPVLSLNDKKKHPMGPGKSVYLSHIQGEHLERRLVPGTAPKDPSTDPTLAAEAAARRADGAVAVAVAAAAVGAAQAAAGAAIAKQASATGEAADLYATAKAFLVENPEFQHIWVGAACMPPRLREHRWRGAVPSAAGSNMFEYLHPGALLACDAVLVVPPERENMSYFAEQRARYTDLEIYSTSPWKALEGAITQLMNSVSFYAFRLGKELIFAGPYPAYAEEPQPSPLEFRRSPILTVPGADSPGGVGLSGESPVDRAKLIAKLFSKGTGIGWNNKPDTRDPEEFRWNGFEGVWGRHTAGSTSTASVTPASTSDSSGKGSHDGGGGGASTSRRGAGKEGSGIDRAVAEALDRLQVHGTLSRPERNWRGVMKPSFVLEKARQDVEKYSDAQGALKQAMCSMSVSIDQAQEFFGVWKHLGVLGPYSSNDRLAVLNLLLFAVSVADGYCCPRRPPDFVSQVLDESLATPGHLDLWMKDLSPDDSRNILRSVNASGMKLSVLTVGSSHTAGAGVGTFLRGHTTLRELELEWEGVRDLASIALALGDNKSLTRLNLTHNEIGPRGAVQLAGALRLNKSLTELDLRENSLGPTGMKAIADALASNDTMRTLHLQDNAIGDDGVIAMTEALMRNGRLKTVCLDGNKVSDVGAKVICIAIKMNLALKLLSLSRNALRDEAKRALYDAWSQRELEDGPTRSGMFLEQAAEGTAGRAWKNGVSPVEGVFVSTRPGSGTGGGGVLVSPTHDRDQGGGQKKTRPSTSTSTGPEPSHKGNSNSNGARKSGDRERDSGDLIPVFSPVNSVKKPFW